MARPRKALAGQAALLPEELEADPRQELLFQTERSRKAAALEAHQSRKQAGRLFENKPRRRNGAIRQLLAQPRGGTGPMCKRCKHPQSAHTSATRSCGCCHYDQFEYPPAREGEERYRRRTAAVSRAAHPRMQTRATIAQKGPALANKTKTRKRERRMRWVPAPEHGVGALKPAPKRKPKAKRVKFRLANGKVISFVTKTSTTTTTKTKKKNPGCTCSNGGNVVAQLELSTREAKRWQSDAAYRLSVIRRAKQLAKQHHGGVQVVIGGREHSRVRPH